MGAYEPLSCPLRRRKFNARVEFLENEFQKDQFAVGGRQKWIAQSIKMTEKQVELWFQARRMRGDECKKKSLEYGVELKPNNKENQPTYRTCDMISALEAISEQKRQAISKFIKYLEDPVLTPFNLVGASTINLNSEDLDDLLNIMHNDLYQQSKNENIKFHEIVEQTETKKATLQNVSNGPNNIMHVMKNKDN
uniref:Homeobox domain-containing protein n=1 Tax=Bactrocera latifrons TaxID=174628 RepID=A0A0K8UVM3_BACLA